MKGLTKNQRCSPRGLLCMRVWRFEFTEGDKCHNLMSRLKCQNRYHSIHFDFVCLFFLTYSGKKDEDVMILVHTISQYMRRLVCWLGNTVGLTTRVGSTSHSSSDSMIVRTKSPTVSFRYFSPTSFMWASIAFVAILLPRNVRCWLSVSERTKSLIKCLQTLFQINIPIIYPCFGFLLRVNSVFYYNEVCALNGKRRKNGQS